jgi:hypothetical protein
MSRKSEHDKALNVAITIVPVEYHISCTSKAVLTQKGKVSQQ